MHKPKKKTYIIVLALLLPFAYLYLSRSFIYRSIGKGGLPSVENQHSYFPKDASGGTVRVYAALGDSLTSGVGTDDYRTSYTYLLANELSTESNPVRLDVFAYPGARTSHIIKDLLAPAIADKPDIVTVLIGTNDIHGFISQRKFRENYVYILEKLTKETDAEIYLLSIPYIGTDSLYPWPWEWFFRYQVGTYNDIIKDLAASYGVRFIDFSGSTMEISRRGGEYNSIDRFHPSAIGYRMWAEEIYARIGN